MPTDPDQIATDVIRQLEAAWNAADGAAFAAPFTDDADFVNIRGDHHRTREAIAHGHQAIFDSIYRGSTVRYELHQARALTLDVILAHVRGTLTSPGGPLAGTHQAMALLVLVETPVGWRVAAFHNTLVAG
ncbi:MAG TPA: SgcJ/EcaC family oxidoreductase [Longimicrobiaceae bacterium]|nr:SgcJ/EcaC family oxidoreductase [Longimicrobiaceae bacterium]